MEPNNFEKDFREKLNQRKIEPSDKAWDRLDAMLSVTENKKPTVRLRSLQTSKKRGLYIAASIVGFLLVGTFFFNQKKTVVEVPQNNVVIEGNVKKDSAVKPVLNVIDSMKTKVAVSEQKAAQEIEKTDNNHTYVSGENSVKATKKEQNQIAESSIIKNNQEKESINNQTTIVEPSKNSNVDQLLSSAEKTVAENSVKPKAKIKINANDLLNQVDGELELSFRERMITKVNKNYQTVKVALANRNQQE